MEESPQDERTGTGEVTLQVLGCGDAFGSGGRLNTCFFVRAPGTSFLIDCGASALSAMKRCGVDPQEIDAVLLTHLHGDHFGGLAFLIRETQIAAARTRPLAVVGPRGVEERVRTAMEAFFPGSAGRQSFRLDFVEYRDRVPLAVGPLAVTAWPVVHTPGTEPHGLRVECAGRVIAYSGDTEWIPELAELSAGADLFLCEAFSFEPKKNHTDYPTLWANRHRLSCKRLLMTHLGEDMLRRRAQLAGEFAEEGMVVRLGREERA
jgi:ribonuclease BN (tRNA processing enzyme)